MAGGGVGLLDGLFLRLNLFAFAVPILCGDPSTVFPDSFGPLLAVLVPPSREAIQSVVFVGSLAPLLAILVLLSREAKLSSASRGRASSARRAGWFPPERGRRLGR